MLTRRHFIVTSAAMFSPAIGGPALAAVSKWDAWDDEVSPPDYNPFTSNPWGLPKRFLPHVVEARAGLRPGDLHVDAVARYVYHIREEGVAMRYGVAIAKGNLYEPGTYRVGRKAKWPTWTPTPEMIAREPETYTPFSKGMPGGPTNPLGARALYLYEGSRDTYLRIHGSPYPQSIGGRASSGCVRMVMRHIIDLYPHVDVGVTAYLYAPEEYVTASN